MLDNVDDRHPPCSCFCRVLSLPAPPLMTRHSQPTSSCTDNQQCHFIAAFVVASNISFNNTKSRGTIAMFPPREANRGDREVYSYLSEPLYSSAPNVL